MLIQAIPLIGLSATGSCQITVSSPAPGFTVSVTGPNLQTPYTQSVAAGSTLLSVLLAVLGPPPYTVSISPPGKKAFSVATILGSSARRHLRADRRGRGRGRFVPRGPDSGRRRVRLWWRWRMMIQALPQIGVSGAGAGSCILATSQQVLQVSVRITASYLPSAVTGTLPALSTVLNLQSLDSPPYTVTLSDFSGSTLGKVTVLYPSRIITYIPIKAGALGSTIVVR